MVLHGCSSVTGGVSFVNYKVNGTKNLASSQCLPVRVAPSRIRCYSGPHQERRSFSAQAGTPHSYLSSASPSFSSPEQNGCTKAIYNLPRRSQPAEPPKASPAETGIGGLFSYKAPPMTEKPRWWWRLLASFPFIMPFHETWMFATTAYKFFFPLEQLELLTYPFLRFLGKLPRGFFLWYFIGGYLGIVRRKEWPHFIRFNMCLGLLVEISFHIFGACNRWMPKGILQGRIGQVVWTAIAVNHFFTVCGCILCALWGTYADIPFLSDAAYLQIPQA